MKKLNLEISVKYFKDYIITLILQDFFFSIPFLHSCLLACFLWRRLFMILLGFELCR